MQFILLASDLKRDFNLTPLAIYKARKSSSLYSFLDKARADAVLATDSARQASIDEAQALHEKTELLVLKLSKLGKDDDAEKASALKAIRDMQF